LTDEWLRILCRYEGLRVIDHNAQIQIPESYMRNTESKAKHSGTKKRLVIRLRDRYDALV
jgi:hypothetical protein